MALTVQMQAAVAAPAMHPFVAVRIAYPTFTLRLLDYAGFLVIGGETYVGTDATYGGLIGVESVTDGGDSTAPRTRVILNPPTNSALAALANPLAQESAVTIYEGCFDEATGLVVPDPDVAFFGKLDQPVYSPLSRNLSLDCSSFLEGFFEVEEGVRLTDSWLQSTQPGARGLEHQTGLRNTLPWGSEVARPATSAAIRRAISLSRAP